MIGLTVENDIVAVYEVSGGGLSGRATGIGGCNGDNDCLEKLWGASQDLASESLVSAVEGRVWDKEVREDGVDVGTGEVRTGRGHVMVPVVYY